MASVLRNIEDREASAVSTVVERMLGVANVIDLSLPIFQQALIDQRRYGLSLQDAIMYASVFHHVARTELGGPHFFANKNKKDFSDPGMARELRLHDCRIAFDFHSIRKEIGVR